MQIQTHCQLLSQPNRLLTSSVYQKVQFHWLDYGMGWKDKLTDDLTGLHVIPQGIDKHKLDSDATYRKEVTTMIQNSLVHSLLDLEEPACKDLGKGGTWLEKRRECLGYRNQEFPGGTCVFDNKGVEYQNTKNWREVVLPPKCRSMYDYIHHELHKEKCEGFQMPTPEALAEWFVSRVRDYSLTWQNFFTIVYTRGEPKSFILDKIFINIINFFFIYLTC